MAFGDIDCGNLDVIEATTETLALCRVSLDDRCSFWLAGISIPARIDAGIRGVNLIELPMAH